MDLIIPKKQNLLFLSLISFIFITSCALALANNINSISESSVNGIKTKVFADLPVLNDDPSFPILSSQAALAVDMGSGISLYEKEIIETAGLNGLGKLIN